MTPKRDKSRKGNQDRKEKAAAGISISRFLITYLMLMIAFFFAWVKPIHKIIDVNGLYTQYVVVATAKILTLLGIPSTFQGSIIALPGLSLDVKFGCNGLEAVLIYSIAVLAYPAHWKKKIVGIAAGFFLLQAANILRIVLLVYSGIHFKNLFEYIHTYIAQGIMIVLSLIFFFIYLDHVKNDETAHH